jgi:transcriptional regulator with XRE-family HTH domain
MQLGKKIRDLRSRRGLTVQQLAAASGLSKGFISQVENDRTSPSLATLRDLARALDTSVAYLVVEDDHVPYVVRQGQRPQMPMNGDGWHVEVLSAQPRRNLELLMAELPPGSSAGKDARRHDGEECVLCLEGRVTVTCGEHRLVLEAGDSCHFDGRAPHAVENSGASTARVLIAVTAAAYDPAPAARKPVPASTGSGFELEPLG